MKKNVTRLLIAIISMLSISITAAATDTSCTHQWSGWNTVKNATVTKKGLQSHECINCGKTENQRISKLKPFVKFTKKKIELKISKTQKLKIKYAKGDSVKKMEDK